MVRQQKGAGRVQPKQSVSAPVDDRLPSMRQRRPVVFWVVILGVVAMTLATVSSFVTLLIT
jgi:hypothetical protein